MDVLTERIAEVDETIPELPHKDLVSANEWLVLESFLPPFTTVSCAKHGRKTFRIYRDIRFSKDPTPYKTHFSAAWYVTLSKRRLLEGKHEALTACSLGQGPVVRAPMRRTMFRYSLVAASWVGHNLTISLITLRVNGYEKLSPSSGPGNGSIEMLYGCTRHVPPGREMCPTLCQAYLASPLREYRPSHSQLYESTARRSRHPAQGQLRLPLRCFTAICDAFFQASRSIQRHVGLT